MRITLKHSITGKTKQITKPATYPSNIGDSITFFNRMTSINDQWIITDIISEDEDDQYKSFLLMKGGKITGNNQ